jgi:hypothetical protein
MEAFSDALIFASLTLLAIIVAIFVLAASLLGRAIQQAREEQRQASEREREEAEAQTAKFRTAIAEVQKKLDKAETSEVIRSLKKELRQYEKQCKASTKKSRKAARRYGRYRVLTAPQGVLPTSVLVLASLVLAAAGDAVTADVAGYALLSLSGSLLIGACYRIYQSLRVVQDVAVTTAEAQFEREAQALQVALERHEEKKLPKLKLSFLEREPPFVFKPGAREVISVRLALEQGHVARRAELWVFAPEGFEFPEGATWHQRDAFTPLPKALTTKFELGDLLPGTGYRQDPSIKTPSTPGTYTCGYSLTCEGFNSGFVAFEVKIAE